MSHLASEGEISWYDYIHFVIAQAREIALLIQPRCEVVLPGPTAAFSTLALRPLNSRLSTQTFQTPFDPQLPQQKVSLPRV